jgi:hypothetical protein
VKQKDVDDKTTDYASQGEGDFRFAILDWGMGDLLSGNIPDARQDIYFLGEKTHPG